MNAPSEQSPRRARFLFGIGSRVAMAPRAARWPSRSKKCAGAIDWREAADFEVPSPGNCRQIAAALGRPRRTGICLMQGAARPHGILGRSADRKAKHGVQLHDEARPPAQEEKLTISCSGSIAAVRSEKRHSVRPDTRRSGHALNVRALTTPIPTLEKSVKSDAARLSRTQ